MRDMNDDQHSAKPSVDDSSDPSGAEDLFHKTAPCDEEERFDDGDLSMMADVKSKVLGGPREAVHIGRFRVLRMLGMGGMGKVYEAEDPDLGRKVAIKLHLQEAATPEQHERMRREARVLAQLVHDNVVEVYELAEHEGRVYLVMERVEGQTLEELQQPGPMHWRRAVALYAMAGHGLRAAHEQEIVHRDFKPANVIVDRTGRCKVLDFGVARVLSTSGVEETADVQVEERGAVERVPDLVLTRSQDVLGSPAYMAPEVHAGQPATPRSDQFSFCVALYEAVYGRRPYTARTAGALLMAKRKGPPPAPKNGPKVPAWLPALLRRGLSVDPRDRFPSMAELLTELERNRAGRRRWLVSLLAVAMLAVVVVLGFTDFSTVTADPRLEDGRGRVSACLDVSQSVRGRWKGSREVHEAGDDELDDVSAVIDATLGGFARDLGSSCLEADPRFEPCWQQVDRDFDALLARVQERVPLPAASFSGLAHDFALCLEEDPSRTCMAPEDDAGTAVALSEAKSQLAVGDTDAAEESVLRALALAQSGVDRLGEVRASLVLAELYDQTERVDEARETLDDAIAKAMACDTIVPTIDAVLERVEVELHHHAQGQADLAALPLSLAREMLAGEQSGGLRLRRALLEEKEAGVLLTIERRCEEALLLYRSVLTRREEARAEREQQGRSVALLLGPIADAELNLGNALLACGNEDPPVVIGLFEAARQHRKEAVGGGEHPDLATFDFGLGRALAAYGRYQDAVARYEAALVSYTKFGVAGEAGSNAGDVHVALTEALRRLGKLDEAQRHAIANLEIRRSNARTRSPQVMAEALMAVGALALEREAYEEARRYHQEAADVLLDESRARGLDAREQRTLAYAYGNLALARCGLARPGDSASAYEEGRRWQLEPSQLANVGELLREHGCLR